MIIDWPIWAQGILAYLLAQRLGELVYANRNSARLLAEGGREFGAGHYPFFIFLHGGWLIAMAVYARPAPTPDWVLLTLFLGSQILRYWTLFSIGRWWTTRIISAPHFPRIKTGPYRYISHPNYVVVVIEIALFPILFGAIWLALIFSVLNALLLAWRIRVENGILRERDNG